MLSNNTFLVKGRKPARKNLRRAKLEKLRKEGY